MRPTKPSVTARHVAITRASFERPALPTGDVDAEAALYNSLGATRLPRREAETRRMESRTRFFDAEVVRAIRLGVSQVVIVAAGYDGRALRFASPGVRWFEVDHPATQSDKRRRLETVGIDSSAITFVPVDLVSDDLVGALGSLGHDPSRPTLFVVEGLLGYLSRSVSRELLSKTRSLSCAGSRLAVAFPISPRDAKMSEKVSLWIRGRVVSWVGEPWLVRFGADEPDKVLADCGWRIAAAESTDRRDGQRAGLVRYEGRQGVLIGSEPA